jgi:hypothetical protein
MQKNSTGALAGPVPGHFWAEATVTSLLRQYRAATTEEARELLIPEILNLGRVLLNVAAPLSKAAGFGFEAFEKLYNQCQNTVRPWAQDDSNYPQPANREELILDVLYEVQREVRQLRDVVAKTPLRVVRKERRYLSRREVTDEIKTSL